MEQIEMKMALQGAEIKAANLANQVKKFEETKKKTEKILSQMLPKQVADDLKAGKSPMDTCEAYPEVTMLFSDIVTFTVIIILMITTAATINLLDKVQLF